MALVASAPAVVDALGRADAASVSHEGTGFSLLRLSVPARLVMVALAAALLWIAVLWALA